MSAGETIRGSWGAAPVFASVLMHAAGATMFVVVVPRVASVTRWADEPAIVEMNVETDEATAAERAVSFDEPSPGTAPAIAAGAPTHRAPRGEGTAVRRSPQASPSAVANTSDGPASSSWSLSITSPDWRPIDLSEARRSVPLADRPVQPAPTPEGLAPRGLQEQLATRDATLGLGPAGPIVAALRRATAERVKGEGVAVARVVFDGSGHVGAIKLLHTSGPSAAWQQVVEAAARAASADSPSLSGATVDLRIDVRLAPGPVGQTHPVEVHGETWAMASSDDLREVRDIALTVLRIVR